MTINYLSLLVSVLGSVTVGSLWHGGLLFRDAMRKSMGIKSQAEWKKIREKFSKDKKMQQQMYLSYFVQLIASGFMAGLAGLLIAVGLPVFVFAVIALAVAEHANARWVGRPYDVQAMNIGFLVLIMVYYAIIAHYLGAVVMLG